MSSSFQWTGGNNGVGEVALINLERINASVVRYF
jgi:hypothetical protein